MEEIVKCWNIVTHTNQYNNIKIRGFILVSNFGDAMYVGKNPRKDSHLEEGIKYNEDGRRCLGKYPIYQMVAELFVDKSRVADLCKKPQAHHMDFDKTNDRADNLEWLTPSEHLTKHNKHSKKGVKFTEEHKNNMKKTWAQKIADGYKMSDEAIEKMKGPRGPRNLTEEQRKKMGESHLNNTNVLGTKHIHKGTERKMIAIDELDKYLLEGWELGRGKLK